MDRIRVRGGNRLTGRIQVSGAKNAALPLMAAALLTSDTLSLSNLPRVVDIATCAGLLSQHGVDVRFGSGVAETEATLTAAEITSTVAPYELVRRMRASVLVLGPLLARCRKAVVSLPGGCAIGTRPVDLHLKGLTQLGADISIHQGYIDAEAPNGLRGAHIVFPSVSVGATENLLMAASLADGETVLSNAAKEPEVTDLIRCLRAMGADISGAGTDTLTIQGAKALHGATHVVMPDRIETGTFAMAAAITGGDVELTGSRSDHLEAVLDILREAGVSITQSESGLRVVAEMGRLRGVDVMTDPYPGFPTDLQAQMMALMSVARGAALITETIFENRFMHVTELARMGANVTVHGASALVRGVERLTGAPVMATDLRASVSLVLAGLAAEGETMIDRVYHLDRGYQRIEQKLAACGADIERLKE